MTTSPSFTLRLGTRASPLARVQADFIAAHMRMHLPDDYAIEIVAMTTKGDQLTQQKLIDSGGKGLFTGEIDLAVSQGEVDIAVHSLKDMPITLPAGQDILAIPTRADPREGFIARDGRILNDLAPGAILGTASIRREAQTRFQRPDIKIVPFRGNVGTRLKKLEAGEADATYLAMAGLTRLGQAHLASPIPLRDMCPAPCQGLIAVCGIKANLPKDVLTALALLEDVEARIAATIERGFLAGLDGSCRTPIAAHAAVSDNIGHFVGEVYGTTPADVWRVEAGFDARANRVELAHIGQEHAHAIKAQAGGRLPQFEASAW